MKIKPRLWLQGYYFSSHKIGEKYAFRSYGTPSPPATYTLLIERPGIYYFHFFNIVCHQRPRFLVRR